MDVGFSRFVSTDWSDMGICSAVGCVPYVTLPSINTWVVFPSKHPQLNFTYVVYFLCPIPVGLFTCFYPGL